MVGIDITAKLGKSLLNTKTAHELKELDGRDDDDEGLGPRCCGYFSLKFAFITYGVIDII